MAKRASRKKSAKKSSRTRKASTRKTARKRVTAASMNAAKPAPVTRAAPSPAGVCPTGACATELEEEHRVLSHIMWLLFLLTTAVAAFFTFSLMFQAYNQGYALLALVFLGWAYFFKTLGHRIHVLHH